MGKQRLTPDQITYVMAKYRDNTIPLKDIADEMGITVRTISNWARFYKLSRYAMSEKQYELFKDDGYSDSREPRKTHRRAS